MSIIEHMASTVLLRARVDARRKARVEKILARIGLTPSQAINVFFAKVEEAKGIPFPVRKRSNEDLPAMRKEAVGKFWNDLYDDDYAR